MLSRKQKGFTAMPTMPVANKLRFMGDEISRRGCLIDRCAQRGRGANVSSLDTWICGSMGWILSMGIDGEMYI